MPPFEKSKKEELKTYRLLGLSKIPSSQRKRRAIEHRGLEKVIGGNSPDRPSLKIPQTLYWELKEIVYKEFLLKIEKAQILAPLEMILEGAREDLEIKIYDLVVQRKSESKEIGFEGFKEHRRNLLDEVLKQVKSVQKRNPDRYQKLWKETVGAILAQESWLHRVDEKLGIAYIRCFNNALGFQLTRREDFKNSLSQKLGFPIKTFRLG